MSKVGTSQGIKAGNLALIAKNEMEWQKKARGRKIFNRDSGYSYGLKKTKEVNKDLAETLNNIVDIADSVKFTTPKDKQIRRVVRKIASTSLKAQKACQKEMDEARAKQNAPSEKPLSPSQKSNREYTAISEMKQAQMKLTGDYQAALEVISAVSCSLTPGVVSAAAGNLLKGTYQLYYYSSEDKKNQTMLNAGMKYLRMLNTEVNDPTLRTFLKREGTPTTISTIAGLYGKKRS